MPSSPTLVSSVITNPFPDDASCPVYGSTNDSITVNTVTLTGVSCGTPNPSAASIQLTNTTNVT